MENPYHKKQSQPISRVESTGSDNIATPEPVVVSRKSLFPSFQKVSRVSLVVLAVLLVAAGWYFWQMTGNVSQQQSQEIQPSPTTGAVSRTAAIKFACPVPKELCASGVPIVDQGQFLGIGYALPQNTQLLSAFDGRVSGLARADPERNVVPHTALYLGGTGEFQGLNAVYEIFGEPLLESGEVRELQTGVEIGVIGIGTFPKKPPFNGINFLFYVKSQGQIIRMRASDFLQ